MEYQQVIHIEDRFHEPALLDAALVDMYSRSNVEFNELVAGHKDFFYDDYYMAWMCASIIMDCFDPDTARQNEGLSPELPSCHMEYILIKQDEWHEVVILVDLSKPTQLPVGMYKVKYNDSSFDVLVHQRGTRLAIHRTHEGEAA